MEVWASNEIKTKANPEQFQFNHRTGLISSVRRIALGQQKGRKFKVFSLCLKVPPDAERDPGAEGETWIPTFR